ncbi:hypothetical protein F441_02464 [Phytophthora nicotianae CJ01A1]|uniref:Transcription factor CBF/NF-Y/archaeal histone domain-containing protein n=5 Tax=Phytophthora nicotianae TaxID=4792 RepID=W2QPM9_PHYN3|nr:hypothetical protein PPTG_07335 [Phytophthora nicotianae INRA-310]ETI54724.1 hypothetical protein F443_02524 [Phytophthora nicotianae P1569]ETK94589.1 hypothetical protein L915_02399 [Phytophthora nicotianae]ETO83486.1 hypothetical protein F444_02515 [Phytophthora nicotianae P1976]ETP24574.1 hypothetical protein F441_02464 [Phytophthora nicotianae CJ01A1]ETL47964.1 hypothetical protein L916_02373 [Phytophthora nicotianae]
MATLPKGSIEKLLREVVGDDVPISKETIDWVNECAGELLRVIGLEANTIAENASKKENYRISQEHAMAALEVAENGLDNRTNAFLLTRRVLMQNLGMQRYAQEIQELQGSMALESQVNKAQRSQQLCHLVNAVVVAEDERADSVSEGSCENHLTRRVVG